MVNSRVGYLLCATLIVFSDYLTKSNTLELSPIYKYVNLFKVLELGDSGTELLDQLCPNQINFDKQDDESLKMTFPENGGEKCSLSNGEDARVVFRQMRDANMTALNGNDTLSATQLDRRFALLNNSVMGIEMSCPLLNVVSPMTILAQDVGYVYSILQYYNITGIMLGRDPADIPSAAVQSAQDEYVIRLSLQEVPAVLCTYMTEPVLTEINKRINKIRENENMTKPSISPENSKEPQTSEQPEENDGRACFPASARVQLKNGRLITIKELKVGDEIRDEDSSTSRVIMFTHSDDRIVTKFVRIESTNGVIVLSPSHYIYCNGRLVLAKSVRVGDMITRVDHQFGSSGKTDVVSKIEHVFERGLYNPQTSSGKIVIFGNDTGIMASCYTLAVDPAVAHSLLLPLRWVDMQIGRTMSGLSWPFSSGFFHGLTYGSKFSVG